MLTKQLKFDNDVLDTLKAMQFSDDGLHGKLIGTLDRTLYVKVNKALEAMGGKWNKKLGVHIFTFDPRPQVEGLLDSGSLTVERDGFFETPLAVVQRMIELVEPRGAILEPSAGMGAIAKNIGGAFYTITCIEKNEQRAKHLSESGFNVLAQDFLSYNTFKGYETIYMNPPFEENQDIKHVQHAYNLLADGGSLVSIMGEHAFFAQDKLSTAFRAWLEEVDGYNEELPKGSFKESGTGVNARIVVIHKPIADNNVL